MGLGGAMNSGISGLQSFSNSMSVIGNNLANTNTAGFKASRTLFSDLIPDTVSGSGGKSQIGRGAGLAVVDDIFKQGSIESTSSGLDMAIEGSGFFIVRNPDNEMNNYTRAGTFRLDEAGYLTNPEGFVVQGYASQGEAGFEDLTSDIQINTRSFVEGEASDQVGLTTNLDAQEGTLSWDLYNPTLSSNFATTSEVYDSLGNTHLISTYFNKIGDNNWEYHQTVPAADVDNINGNPNDGPARIVGGEVSAALTNAGATADLIVNNNDVALADQDAFEIAAEIENADGNVTATATNAQDFAIDGNALVAPNSTLASEYEFDLDIDGSAGAAATTITVSRLAGEPELTGQDIADQINADLGAGTASFMSGILTINGTGGHNIEISNLLGTNLNAGLTPTSVGIAADTYYGSIELTSDTDITLGGDNESYAGFADGAAATVSEPTMVEVGSGTFSFDSHGLLEQISPDGGTTITETDPSWPNVNIAAGNLDWNNGADPAQEIDYAMNITQFATDSKVVTQQANGYSSGYLTDVAVDGEGTIAATYSNGEVRDMARLALGKFANNNGLEKLGKNLYQATNESGPADIGMPGSGVGKIFSNSLEQSTVDIAEEFTKMITTQRSFQANSKTITTTDEMLNEVINMKR